MRVTAIRTWSSNAPRRDSRLGFLLHRAPIPEEEPIPGEEPSPDEEEPPPHPDPTAGLLRQADERPMRQSIGNC